MTVMVIKQVVSFDLGNIALAYLIVRVMEFFFRAFVNRLHTFIREGK